MTSNETQIPVDLVWLLREISHELRTPMGSMAIWLRLCEDSADPAERSRALAMVHESLRALTRTAEHLLDCSLLLGTRPRLDAMPIGLVGLVRGVIGSIAAGPGRHDVALELDAPGSEEIRVEAEPVRLTRALESILRHAVACRAPRPVLSVRIDPSAAGATLTVPLDPAGWAGLRPLRQHLADLSGDAAPFGLALPIAWELIVLHGGVITHEAAADGGALVIRLPRAQPPPASP